MAAFAAFPLFATYRESLEQFLFFHPASGTIQRTNNGIYQRICRKSHRLDDIRCNRSRRISNSFCIATIDEGLNRTFQVKHLRNWVSRFLLYWALLTLGPVILAMSLAASSYVTGFSCHGKIDSGIPMDLPTCSKPLFKELS